jgi:hypothetical protein
MMVPPYGGLGLPSLENSRKQEVILTSNARCQVGSHPSVLLEFLGVTLGLFPPSGIASFSWVLKVIYIFLNARRYE